MKKLTTLLVCILICSSALAITSNAVVMGEIGLKQTPCPIEKRACLDLWLPVVKITNDAGMFVLIKDQQMLDSPYVFDNSQILENYAVGDIITIYGRYHKAIGYENEDFYFLDIISIVNNNAIKNAVVAGRLVLVCPPRRTCQIPTLWAVVNDTATFRLTKDGEMLEWRHPTPQQFEGFFRGDSISIYGIVSRIEHQGTDRIWYHYELEVISIVSTRGRTKIVTGELKQCEDIGGYWGRRSPLMTIANDTASFVLVKNGNFVSCVQQLSGFSEGDIMSIYGQYNEARMLVWWRNFYYLDIIKILSGDTSEREINIHQIQISPNPTDGQITISGIENFDNATFELFDLTGSLIQSGVLAPIINLSVPQGIYLLTITQNQRVITQERIVVK